VVYTAFCRVVLVLDRTQSPFKTTKTATTAAAATVEARLASPLCFSPAAVSRVMLTQPQWFAYPISIPSFAQPCLVRMSQSPANQNGNRNKEGRNLVSETSRQLLSFRALARARYGRGQAWSIWAKATGQWEA
jgi:hypothetical protein